MARQISDHLHEQLLAALGDHPLAKELAAAPSAPAAGNDVRLIEVPELMTLYVADAISVGAISAKMCGEPKEVIDFMSNHAKMLRQDIPRWITFILHRSDWSNVLYLLAEGAPIELTHNRWRDTWTIEIKSDANLIRYLSFKDKELAEAMNSEEKARALYDELIDYVARIRIIE